MGLMKDEMEGREQGEPQKSDLENSEVNGWR